MGKCKFRDPLVAFCYRESSHFFPEMQEPMLVTLLKMKPHYGQSIRENAVHPTAHPPDVGEVPPAGGEEKVAYWLLLGLRG